ncbi:pyridoxal phosphate-dependent aminotransferase [Neiella marina]|uniref:alanine transaminase n=1 Tax=Neiella holothuriorum TaxID=2870530 RepID=A0ABS7ECY4_9GAMM|nr:pyridoxal phosphate-dependent aminotransferase [Neiella holothuriorum]MBW8190100.1 pyridoxal phosphate-dependent aminotransferase [Neiella holothuriorum]
MSSYQHSSKLDHVCYEIRGLALQEAKRLEDDGHRITKLNIGNPAPFGFDAPEELIIDVIHNLPKAQGYADSKGLFSARKAVMQYCQQKRIMGVEIDDVYMGNGVSELIMMAMQGLLNDGDEMLIPAPDYPLWTAATTLAGGKAVHYHCDESEDWHPDLDDIRAKITPRTRGLLVINPNNPTGAVYPRKVLEGLIEIAREHNLIVFADEIYDKVVYDGAEHIALASLADDLLFVSFNGLSKSYRVAGFRVGWMVLSGAKRRASNYIDALNILSSMRLCANVPCQNAVQAALGGYQSINDLVLPTGRLHRQMETAWKALNEIPGISCVKPKGAMYVFPKLDPEMYPIHDDEKFVLDLLLQEKILVVQGSGFNLPTTDHFRIVTLPRADELSNAIARIGRFLENYRQ